MKRFTRNICLDMCYIFEDLAAIELCQKLCRKDLLLAARIIAEEGSKKYGKEWIESFSKKWTLVTR